MKQDYTIGRINWNGTEIEVRWCPDYMVFDDCTQMAHLEVVSVSPEREPLPITKTGYKSHFTRFAVMDGYEGPEALVRAWLDHEAQTPEWRAFEAANRQLSLF